MAPTKTTNPKVIAFIIALAIATVVWCILNLNDINDTWWGDFMRDFHEKQPTPEEAVKDKGAENTPDPNYDPAKESKEEDSKEN